MKAKRKKNITDSSKDKKQPASNEVHVNMPDTKDIPGQENGTPPPPGEFADITISSAHEEGTGVSSEEKKTLRDAAEKVVSSDQAALERAKPDQYDEEGEPLNERAGVSGSDLDVPGSELDDDKEQIGAEDEENNLYSLHNENEDKDKNNAQR